MRIALGIEYDGSRFHGWQSQQPGVRTAQDCLEAALARVAAQPVRVVCAGRTDAGVHAFGQVVHFDTDAVRPARAWVLGTNVHLPDDLRVLWAQPVPEPFHARFSATGRSYSYLIRNAMARPAILAHKLTWVRHPLDVNRMQQAALPLLGRHDFSSYRAIGCQARSPVRNLRQLEVRQIGSNLVRLDLSADAFLHHMVRNIAGVLIAIGQGERPVSWAEEVLALRDRTLGGVTAPPDGLYLTRVDYPPEAGLQQPPGEAEQQLAVIAGISDAGTARL